MLAGDDDPFHAYKRRLMLRSFLDPLEVGGKTVLEVGCGPGGNLSHLAAHPQPPARLIGIDISKDMLALARQRVPRDVELLHTEGSSLPLPSQSVDLTFTCTALMHVTDSAMFSGLIADICRVTRHMVVLIEPITFGPSELASDHHAIRRRAASYAEALVANGFGTPSVSPLKVRVSRTSCGYIQRIVGRSHRHEGDRENAVARFIMRGAVSIGRLIDPLVADADDIAMLACVRAGHP